MINLLPPDEKKRIAEEKRKKLTAIIWFLILFFILIFVLILYSLDFYISGEIDTQKTLMNMNEKTLEESGFKDFQQEMIESNSTFKKLSGFYKKRYSLIKVIDEISGTLPNGIYLDNLNIDVLEDHFKVNISGFSLEREILFNFRKKIEEAGFNDINFPASNWVKSNNINFSAAFTILKSNESFSQ